MRYAICYVSTAAKNLDAQKIDELLNYTARFNNDHDIRGVLLYSDGNFFHIMEGDRSLVQEIYEDIQNDPRHTDIIQIVGKDIETGAFDGFKAEVVREDNKCDAELVSEYMEQVEGLEPKLQGTVKRMLEVFVETR